MAGGWWGVWGRSCLRRLPGSRQTRKQKHRDAGTEQRRGCLQSALFIFLWSLYSSHESRWSPLVAIKRTRGRCRETERAGPRWRQWTRSRRPPAATAAAAIGRQGNRAAQTTTGPDGTGVTSGAMRERRPAFHAGHAGRSARDERRPCGKRRAGAHSIRRRHRRHARRACARLRRRIGKSFLAGVAHRSLER